MFGAIVEKFGAGSLRNAPDDISLEVGPDSGVFLLTVAEHDVDAAMRWTAALSVQVEDDFGERYTVIVVARDEAEPPLP
jgi:hypothetical protein